MVPVSVPVQITAENFLMTSNLEDYPDNPIYGSTSQSEPEFIF